MFTDYRQRTDEHKEKQSDREREKRISVMKDDANSRDNVIYRSPGKYSSDNR